MRLARSTRVLRLFVAISLLSLLPSLVAPMARVGRYAGSAYGDWLRTQLRDTPSAAFDTAIDHAMVAGPRSLDAFLGAFIEAYGDRQALTLAFTGSEIRADDLLDLLSQRYSRLVGDAVVPDVIMKATPVRGALSERSHRAVLLAEQTLQQVAVRHLVRQFAETAAFSSPLRLLTSLQPLGP